MPHTLAEIFTHACALTKFQKPQQLGRARTACSSIVTSRAQRAGNNRSGQRCCKLRLKHWQRILESCSLSSSLQRGWSPVDRATVPRVLYGIGLRMSLRRRTILSQSLRVPARIALTIPSSRMPGNHIHGNGLPATFNPGRRNVCEGYWAVDES